MSAYPWSITKTIMKKLFIIIFAFCPGSTFSQDLPDFDQVKLEEPADYAAADTYALQASTHLLSSPYSEDQLRLKSLRLVIKWMSGTPDYQFAIDEGVTKICKGNDNLLGLYMAAMTKYSLENKASSGDAKLVKLNVVRMLLAYCENPGNSMKMSKELKRLSEANKKGELEKSL